MTPGLPTMTVDSNVVLDAFERDRQEAKEVLALHPDRATISIASRTADLEACSWVSELKSRGVKILP